MYECACLRVAGGCGSVKEWRGEVPFGLRRQQAEDQNDAGGIELAPRQIEASLLHAAPNSGLAETSSAQKLHTRNKVFRCLIKQCPFTTRPQ